MTRSEDHRNVLAVSVSTRLDAVSGRIRRFVLAEGLAVVVVFLVAAGASQFFLDYALQGLRWSMRAALSGGIALSTVWLLWRRVLSPLRHRFGVTDIANLVERHNPHLASILISATRFSAGQVGPPSANSPALVASVIDRASMQASSVNFDAVVDPTRARRSTLLVFGCIALCVSGYLIKPEMTRIWFYRNVLLQEIEWPKRTHLVVEVTGGQLIGARGDDFVVQAHARGEQPREVDIVFETASGLHGRETMVTVGSSDSYRYRYTFQKAREDFTFYLVGGDDRTETFQARLLERPRVTRTEMRIVPPAYTRLDSVVLGDGERTTRMLPGSTMTIWIETNKPVTKATLMTGREMITEAVPENLGHVASCSPMETHTYHFALVDEVGLENRRPVRFAVRVVPDEPPRARMKLVGVGDMITPQAVLPINVECTDTYGLATADLLYQTSREGQDEQRIPLPTFTPRMTTLSTEVHWSVSTEAMTPGETITLRARATDFNTVTGPGESESPEVILRIVTRDELLAELARREQEYRMDFERLIDSQEQVRGGLLTAARHLDDADNTETLTVELTPLERRQRNIAGSINIIRQQFEQILSELHVNQLDTSDERQRLGPGVVEPLARLAKRDLVAAADAVRQWSRSPSREAATDKATLIDSQQVAILSQMREILASMLQWEGYQEVVTMLRDILRLQQELRTETKESLQEQARDVFDD